MSTTQEFEDDAFISYGHVDNKLGWVKEFHENLEYLLGQWLGYTPKIWRDSRMPGNVYFAAHLEEKIKQSIVLVSILTPGYVGSAWCLGELKEFCRLAKENGGLQVSNRLRIFKVVKTQFKPEQLPPEFKEVKGYDFYEIRHATEPPDEFSSGDGEKKDKRYWNKLNDLAWDIKQVVERAKPQPAKITGNIFRDKRANGTVYLAETTYDLEEERNKIKRELQERGYDILPDKELPYRSPAYEDAVRECLKRCKLSVHLIGESYGIIPDRARVSIVRLQNEVAADYSKNNGFSRLIWMPKELNPQEAEQSEFINYLRLSSDPQKGAELLQTTLEELKSIIQKRLASSNGHKSSAHPSRRKKIYLICDGRDVEGIKPLYSYLVQRKHTVILPLIDESADDSQTIAVHNDNLLQCDAILIYYGSGNQQWLANKQRDLEKLAGLEQNAPSERVKPLLATAIYMTTPETPHKTLFESIDPPLIKNFSSFSPSDIAEFLIKLEGPAGGDDNGGDDGN